MKLYVSNLSAGTSEDDLKALFAPMGQVTSVALITNHTTGQSKRFGFVEMATEAEGQAAIHELHHKLVSGRLIIVEAALNAFDDEFIKRLRSSS